MNQRQQDLQAIMDAIRACNSKAPVELLTQETLHNAPFKPERVAKFEAGLKKSELINMQPSVTSFQELMNEKLDQVYRERDEWVKKVINEKFDNGYYDGCVLCIMDDQKNEAYWFKKDEDTMLHAITFGPLIQSESGIDDPTKNHITVTFTRNIIRV